MQRSSPTAPPAHRAPTPSTDTAQATPRALTRVGILGASGTTGVELAGLLTAHPSTEVAYCTSRGSAGAHLDDLDPAAPRLPIEHPDEVDLGRAEVVFLCVPHGSAGPLAERALAAGARVVDVSGDHRLRSAELHAATYGSERSQPLAQEAAFGLPEFARDAVRDARLVSCPGCYATASILSLAPLAEAGLLRDLAVIDAKSGVSGAGRTPTETTHFCSASGDVRPYKVGRVHRHVAEIEQALTAVDPTGADHKVVFNPHLVPIERGIEATLVVRGAEAGSIREVLRRRYDDEPFVRVLPSGRGARVRAVVGTNRAELSVDDVEGTDAAVLTCAIDNLLKGAAGQAVQNMNLMLGLPEGTGLRA